ncbi:MAG: hypothetical protein ACREO0_05525 [Pseudoxanthomonas sp.]
MAAGSDLGARANYAFCSELHDGKSTSADRKTWLACAIPAISTAGSEIGVKMAIQDCNNR